MYVLFGVLARTSPAWVIGLCWMAGCCLLTPPPAVAQLQAAGAQQPAVARPYVPAIELLPDTIAGLVRVPNLPRFCDAWEKMHIGRLMEEESMQPFVDAQRSRAKGYLESIGNRIGIKVEDLYELASGEVVVSWLPFENDKRRPFALCVVADIRGERAKADKAMVTVDNDLKAGGWTRTDITHQGQEVRIYNTKPKPGQLKVEQIAITLSDMRIIAADRDSVVTDLLDAVAGQPKGESINTLPDFRTVLTRSGNAIREPVKEGGGTIGIEWFARPFQMGRIVRESLEVDRVNQLDVIKLLENQGFEVVRAAGGVCAMAGNEYDLLHRGFVIAPQKEFEGATRMLQFVNVPLAEIPQWVHEGAGSVNRLNLRIEDAFWASEPLINEALGDEIFRDVIEGIRDDEDGPQIDIAKNVLPNLDDQVLLITDNTQPVDVNSERMLVAIRVKDAGAIKLAIRKAMEVEPDASRMDELPEVEIWRVQRGEGDDDFDSDLFKDLEIGLEEQQEEEAPPLLDHWAIAMVDKDGDQYPPYLMFTNHPDLLVLAAKRIFDGASGGLPSNQRIKTVIASLKKLGCEDPAFDRVVRLRLSLRAKYELLRQGRLKDSDSVLSALYRRIFEDEEAGEEDPLNAAKLPPMSEVEQFFPDGGSFFHTTEDGWEMTGFLLK